ncbi:hypothetical protein [Sulfitobacter sp. CB2047]|uniref:hypothetical protein n=1 Tax=Sulfitobacter sp. CB2047 TaxID=1525218 RepID=UPI00190F82EA|nr:hypothetical protein [Sulfitobacter sp. CB2047]ULO22168.1 hypothetical protein IV89_003662 [Sulfitobacter sp. CB2047]
MKRILILLTALGVLASCAQYQEPQANCFTFRAAVSPAELVTPDCNFTPMNGSEGDIAV